MITINLENDKMLEKARRLRWQCRRGMLELDAILQPFFDDHFLSLSNEQQEDFELLLTCSDSDLHTWFLGNVEPKNPKFAVMVEKIRFSKGTK